MTHSIVIPLFNKADYIIETLESLVMQTKRPDELIIVDDASTDDSLTIAKEYLQKQPLFCEHCRVEFIELAENGGPGNARNIGLERAKGELISFLDADDLYHPYLLSIANWKFGAEKLDFMILNIEFMPGREVYPDIDALKKYLTPISEDLYEVKDPLRAVTSPHFVMGVGSNVVVKRKWLQSIRYVVNSTLHEGIDFWYRVLKHILAQTQANIGLLTGNYLRVREVKGSLSRKIYPNYKEIELPPVFSRYKNSKDINDRLLVGMIGRRWYAHSFASLCSVKQKLFFALHYSYLLPQLIVYSIIRIML
ncbi:glycosyltransferase involved in cell wall biosynthesis [Mucilaginibacter frigoritolerans]|uniref:Glycosyltransferase involved in cell wall biosynthesis n=1 Tax=Mucilaginibacter frigoritolerans TaxID=652788 RepID=A0A562TQZ2_9SPHI|nr:glycosyltransferase family 2 protein [Mucilaginibacter frigoritolerans]TWI95952.1 glycosyltransferase involved in cell wall biosynthesis [Mucilaginibacter frigoritolerans]